MSTQPEVIPFELLVDALSNEEVDLYRRYLYRLSDLDDKELALLEEAWGTIPVMRRQTVLADLLKLGEDNLLLSYEAIGRFAITDEDPHVRTLAVQILRGFESVDLIPKFINLLEKDPNEGVRSASASALGRFVYLGELDEISQTTLQRIEDCLLNVIHHGESDLVKCRSLEAIGYSSRPEVPPLIESALASGDKEWIKAALFAIGRSIDKRWKDDVLHFLNNRNPALRAEAARAAGELEISAALPQLIELSEDSNDNVRNAAIWSLSQISGEGVREVLEELWELAEEEADIDLLEAAIDNLEFNQNAELSTLFEFPENGLGDFDLDMLDDVDEFQDIGDNEEDNLD